MFANGGPITTEGSLMAKQNVKLHLIRQDDVPQMQASLLKFAQEYQKDPNTAEGVHFVSIMGDGAAQFLAGLNPQLEKLGKDYRAQVIYTCGRSLGKISLWVCPNGVTIHKSHGCCNGCLPAGWRLEYCNQMVRRQWYPREPRRDHL